VDEDPFSLSPDGDGDRLHAGPAFVEHGAVTGPVIDVAGPQALRAVVAVLGAGCVGGDVQAALDTSERARLGAGPRTDAAGFAGIAGMAHTGISRDRTESTTVCVSRDRSRK
jgi:hypothetical protein